MVKKTSYSILTWLEFNLLKDMCVSHTHFVLDNEQWLLKKLYLRSENDTAKEMHTVTHKKENMKDKKERKKYDMLEYATYYTLQDLLKNMVLM